MIRTSARQPQKLYESCIQSHTLCNGLLLMSMSELQLIWEVRMKYSHPLKTWKEKENPLNLTVRPAIKKRAIHSPNLKGLFCYYFQIYYIWLWSSTSNNKQGLLNPITSCFCSLPASSTCSNRGYTLEKPTHLWLVSLSLLALAGRTDSYQVSCSDISATLFNKKSAEALLSWSGQLELNLSKVQMARLCTVASQSI